MCGKSTDHEGLILGYCPFTKGKTFMYVNRVSNLEYKTTQYFLYRPYNITTSLSERHMFAGPNISVD